MKNSSDAGYGTTESVSGTPFSLINRECGAKGHYAPGGTDFWMN